MPPPGTSTTPNGITGTRTKAEIRRITADRIAAAGRRMSLPLTGRTIRVLIDAMTASGEAPTESEIDERMCREYEALMRAQVIRNRPALRHKWRVTSA